MSRTHRGPRAPGGRLVVGERRLELDRELDEAFEPAGSFTVDDNVYLVTVAGTGPDRPQNSV